MADSKTHVSVDASIVQACDVQTSSTDFELDSASMRTSDPNLDRVADCLANGALKDRNIRVAGYPDARGNDDYGNKRSGETSAETVAQYFEAKGVSPNKIITKSYGKDLAVGNTEKDPRFQHRVTVGLAD